MGVASPQREKSCVAPSTDAPCFPPPSLGRSEGGEEAEEGACYFGSLGRRCEKNSWLSPKRARSPLVGHYCASCSVGWIECARARRGGSIVGISWGCKVKSTAERRLARLGDTAAQKKTGPDQILFYRARKRRLVRGLVKFVLALACLFCLALLGTWGSA